MYSLLTGKAKEDFLNKHGHKEHEIDDLYLYALIIEWFDSVGIYISIIVDLNFEDEDLMFFYNNVRYNNNYICVTLDFKTRQEATESAITKANEIYNSK